MADKDPKDDELNQEGQDDLNEADDSFGLPDFEFDPLDESDDSDEPDDTVEESVEITVEETFVEDEHVKEVEEKKEPVRKYSRYQQESSNKAPVVILAIIAVILISGGIWYFGFYSPAQKEIQAQEQADKQRQEDLAARQAEEERLARQAEEVAEEEPTPAEPSQVTRGTMTTISAPTQRYYVVVGSFIDGDMATDLGKELASKGVNTSVLAPSKSHRLHRVAIADYGTFNEASNAANSMKSEYGENLWVLKY